MMLRVLSVSGVCSVMKSARANSSSSSTFSTPSSAARCSDRNGSKATTCIFRPTPRVADDRADIAAADDAERLAGDLDAHEAVLLPLAGLRRGVGLGQLAGHGEHHGDGVLGGGDRIAERRVHHDDAAPRGGGNIDIVDADAGAADDLEIGRGGDQLFGDLGRRADGEAVILADDFEQLVLVLAEVGQIIDLDAAILEDLHGGGGEFVGNENAGRHLGFSKYESGKETGGRARACEQFKRALSAAFCAANAQSSQGISASMSDVSTVAPHQMRRPGGASR